MVFKIRVLLADDHATVRQGFRACWKRSQRSRLWTMRLTQLLRSRACGSTLADLVVLDISMRKLSGLSAIGQITATRPQTQIVVLTRHREPAFVRDALSSGASDFVLKPSPFSELRVAEVSRGECTSMPGWQSRYTSPTRCASLGSGIVQTLSATPRPRIDCET